MAMIRGLRRLLRGGGPPPGRRRAARDLTPQVSALESRALQTVVGTLTSVKVTPQILPPTVHPNYVDVNVTGAVAVNHIGSPAGLFLVTDEYRVDEPRGPVALSAQPVLTREIGKFTFYYYAFSFDLHLSTQRSTKTPDGRHYNLFVGAKDSDGTGGKIVTILVPKTYPPRVVITPPTAKAKTTGKSA
jgi:hypothetical protein